MNHTINNPTTRKVRNRGFEPVTSGRRWMLHIWLTDRV